MRHTRMIGVLFELWFEDLRCFQSVGESLVVGRLRRRKINRVKYLRLIIFQKPLRHDFKSIGKRLHARPMRTVAEAIVVFRNRLDVEALALGLGAGQTPALDRLLCLLRVLRGCVSTERVADQNRRDAKVKIPILAGRSAESRHSRRVTIH